MGKSFIFGLIGLLTGLSISFVILSTRPPVKSDVAKSPAVHDMNSMKMENDGITMSSMVSSLNGKTGEEFDKAFISGMIEHHQGAIDMATIAKQSAKHDEIKTLSTEIISAQESEITKMKEWHKEWGYSK